MRLDAKPPGPTWDKIAGVYRHGRRAQRASAHQLSAPSRRHAEAARAAPTSARPCRLRCGNGRARRSKTAAADAKLVATMMRSPAEWAGASAGERGGAAARCWRSAKSARPPPARFPAPASGRCPASACSISRASSPARCAGARSPRTAPTSCASRRRTCPGFRCSTSTPAAASSRPRSTCAPRRSASGLRGLLRRGACVRAGLSSGRHRLARFLARGLRRAPARHRRRVAVGLRPRRSVGLAPRLRLAGAERSGINHAEAEAAGMPRAARSCPRRRSTMPRAT